MSAVTRAVEQPLPFTARCGFGWSVTVLLLWPIILWFFVGARSTDGDLAVVDLWSQGGIVKRMGIILLLVLIPGVPLEVFRAKTVFGDDEIRHIPPFGRQRTYRYPDIVDLEIFPQEFSRFQFRDWANVESVGHACGPTRR